MMFTHFGISAAGSDSKGKWWEASAAGSAGALGLTGSRHPLENSSDDRLLRDFTKNSRINNSKRWRRGWCRLSFQVSAPWNCGEALGKEDPWISREERLAFASFKTLLLTVK